MFRDDITLCVLMAAITCIGCVIDRVTSRARDLTTFTMIQRESMVPSECCRGPCSCSVARLAVSAELSCVFDRFCMARNTGRLRTSEDSVDMTAFAINCYVRSRQREITQAVIK